MADTVTAQMDVMFSCGESLDEPERQLELESEPLYRSAAELQQLKRLRNDPLVFATDDIGLDVWDSDYLDALVALETAHAERDAAHPRMLSGGSASGLTEDRRYEALAWLVERAHELRVHSETFTLAVLLYDRVCACEPRTTADSLAPLVCLALAAKLREPSSESVYELVLHPSACFGPRIVRTETHVLELLNWRVNMVTPHAVAEQLFAGLAHEGGAGVTADSVSASLRARAFSYLDLAALVVDMHAMGPLLLAGAAVLAAAARGRAAPARAAALRFVTRVLRLCEPAVLIAAVRELDALARVMAERGSLAPAVLRELSPRVRGARDLLDTTRPATAPVPVN